MIKGTLFFQTGNTKDFITSTLEQSKVLIKEWLDSELIYDVECIKCNDKQIENELSSFIETLIIAHQLN